MLPQPTFTKNDKKARILIIVFSTIVFVAITALSRIKWDVELGFDKHLFAKANAFINTTVSLLLILALIVVKKGNYGLHKKLMLAAMLLSILFLVSYICHHLFTGDAKYGDSNHDGVVDAAEKLAAGNIRYFYYFIVGTHILLAGIVMPFVLFTAYSALIGEYAQHKKLARITWPIWLYVAVTGPIVYWMVRQYYQA
jgi:putative membrane protein